MTKATSPKPSDDQDASGPGPSTNKEATSLGLSPCAKGGTDLGPSQQAESSIKKENSVLHAAASKQGSMACFLGQCKSSFSSAWYSSTSSYSPSTSSDTCSTSIIHFRTFTAG